MHEVAFITENDLLTFTAIRRCPHRIERCASVCFIQVRISDGRDLVVVAYVNRRDVDGVLEAPVPIAGGIELSCRDVVDACFMECLPGFLSDHLLRETRAKNVIYKRTAVGYE